MLREVQQFHPNLECLCAVGHLRTKVLKVNQVRLRLILKNIKNYELIKMDVIRRRSHKSRCDSSDWHHYYTCKLFKCKFSVSSAVDGFIHCIVWLICPNNNRGIPSHNLFKEAIDENVISFQVRGDDGSENRLIAKYMVMVCSTQCRGHIGHRHTHNEMIDHFWRELNASFVTRLKSTLERLESLGHKGTDDGVDLWLIHCDCARVVNKKNTHELKNHHN